MKRIFISSSTALPDYQEKKHLRAFCIHTVMTQDGNAPAGGFEGKELPWQNELWRFADAEKKVVKFLIAEVDLSKLKAGDKFTPSKDNLKECVSLEAPALPTQEEGGDSAFENSKEFTDHLTSQWKNPKTKLSENLLKLPGLGEVEEDDLEKGSDDPDAQSGSAWLASLVQQSWPVPQLLRLSQFVVMPEDYDPSKTNTYLVYPDRGDDPEITYQQKAENSEEIWEVSWEDGISFQIAHEHTVPLSLATGSGNVPNFLPTKEVKSRQPDTTRFWGQELPLLFGKTLNLCEWFAELVKDKRIDYTKLPHEAVRKTAIDLLRIYGHDGLLFPSPANNDDDRTKDEEAAGLFPSRFPLQEMLPVIRDRFAKLEEKNPDLKLLLNQIVKVDAVWDPMNPPVSRVKLSKELKRLELDFPDSEQWRYYVGQVLAKRIHSSDDSGFNTETDPKKREERDIEITKRFVRRVADLSNDDDVLIELWSITWLHATVSSQKQEDAYKSISEAFDSCNAALKAAVQRSGRRLAEHYGDTVARTFWRDVSRTYRREIETGNADTYAPVYSAVKIGHSLWLKMLADGKAFPIEADVMKELASQSPDGNAPDGEKKWLGEMSLRITGSQGKQDQDVMVFQPAYDFHPLQVLPPGLDTSKYRGMAIFCRAVGADPQNVPRNKTLPWRCLTLGRAGYEIRRRGEKRLVSYFSGGSVTAHAADECNGIQQSYLGYRMRRIGLTEETLNTSQEVSGAATGDGGEDPGYGFICHDLAPTNTWGQVTALRYSRNLAYEFAFVAIHNSGALPKGVAKPDSPCELADPGHIKELLNAPSNEEFKTITLQRRYLRRVAIGSPRFNATTAALKTGELPSPPPGIALLADDLYNSDFSNPDTSGTPAPRPQVIFLHDGRREFGFKLTAPSIDRQIWRSWVLGQEPDLSLKPEITFAAVTLHHLAGMGNEERQEGVVLSDPSVCGIHISLGSVCPETKNVEGCYLPLEFKKALTGKAPSEFGGKPGEFGEYLKGLDEQQKRTLKNKIIIQITETGALGIARSNGKSGDVEISVPRSHLAYLRISPCISVADFERFEIYPPEKVAAIDAYSKNSSLPDPNRTTLLATKDDKEHTQVVRINRAALNWRVEVAPSFEGDRGITEAVKSMPLPLEIFKALALERNQPHGEKSYPAGSLRSSLKMDRDRDLYQKWLWVSGVKTVVQKWRWNGLPQGSCGEWYGAGSDTKGRPRRRGMASVLDQVDSQANPLGAHVMNDSKACEAAETSAFGNRDPEDATGHLSNVNYADKYLGWIKDPKEWEAKPIDIELHCEEGDAGRDPAYYRVRLEVTHRYAALVANQDLRKKLTIHSNAIEELSPGKPKKDSADTPWKRILLAGLEPSSLAQPRVKMVLPMMDVEIKGDAARPGFVVLTRDSLPSPFHRLIATLEIADYRTYADDWLATVDLLPEIGPDPVTSKMGSGIEPLKIKEEDLEGTKPPGNPAIVNVADEELDWEDEAVRRAKEKFAVTIEGEPFGLSWEREAGSPLFPHAGFFFDMVKIAKLAGITEASLKIMLASDLMAKLRFRWQLDRSALWSAGKPFTNQYFQGKESGAWWVRSLAPFRLNYEGDASKGDLQFKYDPFGTTSSSSNASLSFYHGDKPLPFVPRFAAYDSVGKDNSDTELCSALIFICWADISDGTSNRRSRTVADAFLVDVRLPGLTAPPKPPVPLMNHGGGNKVVGGQLFLIHFRGMMYDSKFDAEKYDPNKDARPQLSTLLYRWITQPDAEHAEFGPSFDLLSKYLFTSPYAEYFKLRAKAPGGGDISYKDESKYTPDAQGMVVRSSPILAHISR